MSNDKIVLAKDMIFDNDIDNRGGLNGHVLLVGPTGCGKTTSHIIPNMLHKDGSFVVVDYKGNLYRKFNGYFTKKGYVLKKVDLTDVTKSAHYNPLSYIKTEQDITKVAEILTGAVKAEKDPFWRLAGMMLLRGLISIVVNENCVEERNMRAIIELLDKIKMQVGTGGRIVKDEVTERVEYLIEEGRTYRGLQDYLAVTNSAEDTYRSIVITLRTALSKYTSECVLSMMDNDEIDIESIAIKRTALFIQPSDTDSSLDELAALLYTQLFQELCNFADDMCEDNENRLPVAVHFIFDDFATGCPIPDFDRIISNIRSRNMTAMLGIQSMQQLNLMYKDNGKIIADNCDSRVYFSTMSPETIEEASKLTNYSQEKIRNMKLDEVLVIRRGEKPVLTKRYDTYSDAAFLNMKKKGKAL